MPAIVFNIGFTGTRKGMNEAQKFQLGVHLYRLSSKRLIKFHHGDCVGADEEAHEIAKGHGYHIVIHPPLANTYRASCEAPTILLPLPYLVRNKRIVDACDVLFCAPEGKEKLRSGTWSTIRYANRRGINVVILGRNS